MFPDEEWSTRFDPLADGPALVEEIDCDGLLINTFNKSIGKGLVDYYDPTELGEFVKRIHNLGKEAWLAGSISKDDLSQLWPTGVDVICVRSAAIPPRQTPQGLAMSMQTSWQNSSPRSSRSVLASIRN